MDVEAIAMKARQGDLEAFAELTRRFQHMAFGYAVSVVRDLASAEDVVQEAFVAAWFALPTLADPAAFPGWLRGIVRHQAYRVLRHRELQAVPLAMADDVAAGDAAPDTRLERRQRVTVALGAIARLAPSLREVFTLFYVHECSQQDIATFLGLPVTTVNNRLHAARTMLKRRMITMVKDTLETHGLPNDFAARIGRIVRAREGVVDARFDSASLPDVLTELTVSDEPRQRAVTVQVVQPLPGGIVRCVVTSPEAALSPGMSVLASGRRAEASLEPARLDRTVRALTGERSAADARPTLLETGIKVVDVMCPLASSGTVAIAGEARAGVCVLVEELVRRLSARPRGVSLFTLVPAGPWGSFQEMWKHEGYSSGTHGSVQTFYFVGDETWTAERLSALTGVDAVVRLSAELAAKGIWPAIDPIASRSRLLDGGVVGERHVGIAARVRQAMTALRAGVEVMGSERALARAQKLQRFFAQPFFVAEPYTRRPGSYVALEESLRVCEEILDGMHDDLPEDAFYFTGGIDEIRAKAGS